MNTPRRVAINQPAFMPWIGWFDLVDDVDIFILLDDVPFSKQSWQQRNRIRTPEGLSFISVPVKTSGSLGQLIQEVVIANPKFPTKLLKTLQANYAKAPFFKECFPELEEVVLRSTENNRLIDLNSALISWMLQKFGITVEVMHSSKMGVSGKRGEYVANLCAEVSANLYLSPAGSEDYLVEDKSSFDSRGIEIVMQNFDHPVYPQVYEPFMSHASALDLIFNVGPEALEVLRSGRRQARPIRSENAKDVVNENE